MLNQEDTQIVNNILKLANQIENKFVSYTIQAICAKFMGYSHSSAELLIYANLEKIRQMKKITEDRYLEIRTDLLSEDEDIVNKAITLVKAYE